MTEAKEKEKRERGHYKGKIHATTNFIYEYIRRYLNHFQK